MSSESSMPNSTTESSWVFLESRRLSSCKIIKSNQIKSNEIKTSNWLNQNGMKFNHIRFQIYKIMSDQAESSQIISNQIKSEWIKIKTNHIKSNQVKSNQVKSNQIKVNQNQTKINQRICQILPLIYKLSPYSSYGKQMILSETKQVCIKNINSLLFISFHLLISQAKIQAQTIRTVRKQKHEHSIKLQKKVAPLMDCKKVN